MKNLIYILGLLVLSLSSCDELFNGSGIDRGAALPPFLVIDAETYEDLLDPNTEGYYPHDSIAMYRVDGQEQIEGGLWITRTSSGDHFRGLYKLYSGKGIEIDWENDIGETYTYHFHLNGDIDTLKALLTEEKALINFTYNGEEIPMTELDTAVGSRLYTIFK